MMNTRTNRRTVACLLAFCMFALLPGCQSKPRVPQDETVHDPVLDRVDLVDIAVLKPDVQSSKSHTLSNQAREACRRALIDGKHYSVPSDEFVDTKLSGRKLAPAQSAGILGADGVLEVVITEWDSTNLIPRGHVYAAGVFTLYGSGKTLWKRTFKDRKCLSATQVSSGNRVEAESQVMHALVRDILGNLPRKKTR